MGNMVLRLYTGVTYFILFLLNKALGERKCNATNISLVRKLFKCSETEYCDEKNETCECLLGYVRKNETTCMLQTTSPEHTTADYSSMVDNHGNGSLLAGILVPVFLIIVVICTIYLNKKYELVKWLRQRLYQRNEHYDEFMIGQDLEDDDPPLR